MHISCLAGTEMLLSLPRRCFLHVAYVIDESRICGSDLSMSLTLCCCQVSCSPYEVAGKW